MPRLFDMGDLVTMCQQQCDKEHDQHIGAAEWKRRIGTVYGDLWGEIAKTGLRYFETRETITTTGAASYDEPVALLATVGIDRVYPDGTRRELRELMAQQRNRFAGRTGDAVAYEHVDDQLYLWPRPPTGQTYELLYIPQPPQLTEWADTDQVDVVTPDGEAFIIWGVKVGASDKEESDVRVAIGEREAARARVVEWATLKAFHQRRRIVVEDDEPYFYDPGEYLY